MKALAVHFNRDGRPRCGARPRVPLLADGESGVTCGHCTAHLNGTYGIGNRWIDIQPCGTPAAYYRELRSGGPVHPWCREAANRDALERKERRQRRNQKGLAA